MKSLGFTRLIFLAGGLVAAADVAIVISFRAPWEF